MTSCIPTNLRARGELAGGDGRAGLEAEDYLDCLEHNAMPLKTTAGQMRMPTHVATFSTGTLTPSAATTMALTTVA